VFFLTKKRIGDKLYKTYSREGAAEMKSPSKACSKNWDGLFYCLGNCINPEPADDCWYCVHGLKPPPIAKAFLLPAALRLQSSQGKKNSKMLPHGFAGHSFPGLLCVPCGLCEKKGLSDFALWYPGHGPESSIHRIVNLCISNEREGTI
jgi:hypothetical protein